MKALLRLAQFFLTHPLTRNAPHKAWWRFLSWQVKSRLREEVIVPWISGQRLAVRRGMTGATGNVYVGLHEFADMCLAVHFLRYGDLFLDVGANVGSYTVLASGVSRATTWAFEPDPVAVQRLKRNIQINALDDLVRVYQLALGGSECHVPFTTGLDTLNKIALVGAPNIRIIQQRTLDALIGDQHPIMIKVDVEGYEEEVLRGARSVLFDTNLMVIDLETVTPAVDDMLKQNGFIRGYYEPLARKLERRPTALSGTNSVFVRNWEFVCSRVISADPIEVLGQVI